MEKQILTLPTANCLSDRRARPEATVGNFEVRGESLTVSIQRSAFEYTQASSPVPSLITSSPLPARRRLRRLFHYETGESMHREYQLREHNIPIAECWS